MRDPHSTPDPTSVFSLNFTFLEEPNMRIDELKAAPYNPRKITPEALAGLKSSIVQFGDIAGLTWNRRTGNMVAGHQRLRALRTVYTDKLTMEDLGDTIVLRAPDGLVFNVRVVDWDEKQEKAANVAANNPHIAGEFDEKLDALLAEINEWNPDVFGDLRLDALMGEMKPEKSLVDPDETPEELPVEATTKHGDLIILGAHRLLCGDSTKTEDVALLMEGGSAAMAFTDPPYNVAYEGAAGSIMNDALGNEFQAFLDAVMTNLLSYTDGACYVAMSSSELDTLQAAFRKAGGHWSTFIIWAKDRFTLGRSDYQRQYEPILYGWRKGAPKHYWCGDRSQGDVWHCDKPTTSKLHPTTKPVDLIVRALLNSSRIDDVVLDLFGGSGSTLIACESAQRRARLMELDPKFCDVIVARWEKFTGRKALRP